jgi:hypothetical protein
MDDIVILSTSYKENLRHVAAVLDPLRQNCLAIKPSKCRFNQPQVRFLGFVITTTGLSTDPAYSRAVTNFPSPSDQPTPSKKVDAVERFCGMAGFYRPSPNDQPTLSKKVDAVERLCGMAGFCRRFARNLAVHKRALRELTMANTLWIWGEAQQTAFLRRCQTHPKHCSYLAYSDFTLMINFIITTDAIQVGIGAVLSQAGADGFERPIFIAPRVTTLGKSRNAPDALKALVVVHYVEFFKPYVGGSSFMVVTDHRALVWLFSSPRSSMYLRWILRQD